MRIWLKRVFGTKKRKREFSLTRITRHINSPEEAAKLFRRMWDRDLLSKQEEVYVIFVDEENKVIHHQHLHTGGICETIIDTKLLFRLAIEVSADGFFLAHNHPKGSLKPSPVDKEMTTKIRAQCIILGITLWDHIILTPKSYFSFAEGGLLD